MRLHVTAFLGGLLAILVMPGTAGAATYCAEVPSDDELAEVMSVDDGLIGGMSGISMAEPFQVLPSSDDYDAGLWCATPDDPRCHPTNVPSDGIPTAGSLELRFGGPDLPTVAAPHAADVQYLPYVSRPARGVWSRIERPPRS